MDRIDARLNTDRIDILIEPRDRKFENLKVKTYRKLIYLVIFLLNLISLLTTCYMVLSWTGIISTNNTAQCVNEYKVRQVIELNLINNTKNGGKS